MGPTDIVLRVTRFVTSSPAASGAAISSSLAIMGVDRPTRASLLAIVPLIGAGSVSAQTRWTVEPRPVIEIASESQGAVTLFTRVAHVEQLPTGELLVVDGATHELRFVGADGRFRRKVGRNGAGPGEYRSISGVVVHDGRVNVFDASQARITRMTLAGGSVTTMVVGAPPDSRRGIWSYAPGGVLDGRPVFLASGFPSRNSAPARYTDSVPQYIYSRDAATAKRIGEMVIMDALFESARSKGDVIFGRFSASVVGGRHLFVTDGGRFAVRAYDASGALVRTIGRELPPQRVTGADFEEYVSFRQQFAQNMSRSDLRGLLSAIPRAEFKPFISRLLVDDQDNLWVEHWTVRQYFGPGTWSVFDPLGRLLAEATFPRGFRPSTIRGGVVAGVQYDDDGVEGIQLLRVRR